MGFSSSVDTIVGTSRQFPELLCQAGAEIEKVRLGEKVNTNITKHYIINLNLLHCKFHNNYEEVGE